MENKNSDTILNIVNIPWFSGLAALALDVGAGLEKIKKNAVFAVVGDSPLFNKASIEFRTVALPGRDNLNTIKGIFEILRNTEELGAVIAYTGSSFFIGMVIGLLKRVPVYRVRAEQFQLRQ
jgi:hypothetical protein